MSSQGAVGTLALALSSAAMASSSARPAHHGGRLFYDLYHFHIGVPRGVWYTHVAGTVWILDMLIVEPGAVARLPG
jgi:hypothetical protein